MRFAIVYTIYFAEFRKLYCLRDIKHYLISVENNYDW